jgi:hypothetical protein
VRLMILAGVDERRWIHRSPRHGGSRPRGAGRRDRTGTATTRTMTTGTIMGVVTKWERPCDDPQRIVTGVIAVVGSAFSCVFAFALVVLQPVDPRTRVQHTVLAVSS